jgi:hypothetical protein
VLLTLGPASLLPLHILPTLFHYSPSSPISLPGTHGWAGYSPMGLVSSGGRVEDNAMRLVTFGRVSNSDHFRLQLQFNL